MIGVACLSKLKGAVFSAALDCTAGAETTATGRVAGAGAGGGVLTSAAAGANGGGATALTGTLSTAVGAVCVLGCVVGGVLTGVCIAATEVPRSMGSGVLYTAYAAFMACWAPDIEAEVAIGAGATTVGTPVASAIGMDDWVAAVCTAWVAACP